MGHGKVKQPPVKQAVPATGSKKAAQAPVKSGAASTGGQPIPPKVPPIKSGLREKHIIWADDNDVDIEDVTFVVPIIISVIILVVFIIRKYIRWSVECPSGNRLYGKTVVITGGNSGIGRATATELAKRGGRVILGCRDKMKGDAVVIQIRNKTQNPDVFCYRLDLASLTSIKDFADEFNNREPSLHVLINNAAYMGPKSTTEDGYERTFGVNYLGHFYLTYLLKDKLKRGAPSRVINMISDSYSKVRLNFDDLPMVKYDIYGAYARSKLAMVVFNHELARRLASDIIHVYGVHPGCVSTELLRNWPGITGNVLRTSARVLFKSPEDGCQTVVFCAVADKMREQTGKVFENCNVFKISNFAKDRELGEKLWNVSLHLCGLDSEIPDNKEKEASSAAPVEKPEKPKPAVQEVGASQPPAETPPDVKKEQ